MALGKNVSGTDDGFNINSNNYWYTDGSFKVGSSAYYLTNDYKHSPTTISTMVTLLF